MTKSSIFTRRIAAVATTFVATMAAAVFTHTADAQNAANRNRGESPCHNHVLTQNEGGTSPPLLLRH